MTKNIVGGVQKLFSKYLLLTNTATSGCLLALGDVITQKLEYAFEEGKDKDNKFTWNWKRTGRMMTIGLMMGPFGHLWYSHIVDRMVKGSGTKVALKKILADQIFAGPFFCSGFFFGMGILEGRGAKGGIQEVREKFLTVYLIDWCVWPPAQFINFRFMPVEYRMVYVCGLTLVWNTFLSYIKHRHPHTESKLADASEKFH